MSVLLTQLLYYSWIPCLEGRKTDISKEEWMQWLTNLAPDRSLSPLTYSRSLVFLKKTFNKRKVEKCIFLYFASDWELLHTFSGTEILWLCLVISRKKDTKKDRKMRGSLLFSQHTSNSLSKQHTCAFPWSSDSTAFLSHLYGGFCCYCSFFVCFSSSKQLWEKF